MKLITTTCICLVWQRTQTSQRSRVILFTKINSKNCTTIRCSHLVHGVKSEVFIGPENKLIWDSLTYMRPYAHISIWSANWNEFYQPSYIATTFVTTLPPGVVGNYQNLVLYFVFYIYFTKWQKRTFIKITQLKIIKNKNPCSSDIISKSVTCC